MSWPRKGPGRERIRRATLGERNGFAKLKSWQVRRIRAALRNGVFERDLAEKWGVSKTTIHKIKVRETWRSVR